MNRRHGFALSLLLCATINWACGLVLVADSVIPTNKDPSSYKSADTLWNETMDRVMWVQAAEMSCDHQTSAKTIPSAKACVREFIARYPHDRLIWAVREWDCDLDLTAHELGLAGAPSLQDIVARYENLSRDEGATKQARGIARAKAICAMLNDAQGSEVSSKIWKNIGKEVTEFEQEFGPNFSFDHHHYTWELQADLKWKSSPFNLKFTSVDGSSTDISSLRGKVVLVDFWATWCGGCVNEMPQVLALYQKYHGEGLEVIGVSLDEDRSALVKFTTDHGIPWPQYLAGTEVWKRFGIQSIPTVWLIDKKGMLATTSGRDGLEEQLKKLLHAP